MGKAAKFAEPRLGQGDYFVLIVDPEPLSTISIPASRLDGATSGTNGSARIFALSTISLDKPTAQREPLGRSGAEPHQ